MYLRKNKTNKVKPKLDLRKIGDHRENMRRVLDVYLDPSFERRVSFKRYRGEIFEAFGVGYDGERQSFRLFARGNGDRFYLDKKGLKDCRAPFETGKVLCLVRSLGYELTSDFTRIALRYKRYVETGVSHLDNREELDN